MKAVLISIQPQWCELIASGKKTVEVRKTKPDSVIPFKCYIYQTKRKWIYKLLEKLGLWQGKVIGEFHCNWFDTIEHFESAFRVKDPYHLNHEDYTDKITRASCLDYSDLLKYLERNNGYAWHISNLKIYDKPKELGEFHKIGYYYELEDLQASEADYSGEECYSNHKEEFEKKLKNLEKEYEIKKAPESWCYVEELEGE